MIKIKFPKKISENRIKQFFIQEGLSNMVSKKSYYIDGYQVAAHRSSGVALGANLRTLGLRQAA